MKRLFGILFVILLILSSCATVKQEKEISQTTTIECNSDSQDFKSQSTLSHIALNDRDSEVRKLAIKKLTIQSTLSCFSPLYFRTRLVTENTNFEYDTN